MTLLEALNELSAYVNVRDGLRVYIVPEVGGVWTVVIDEVDYPDWRKTMLDLYDAVTHALEELEERELD